MKGRPVGHERRHRQSPHGRCSLNSGRTLFPVKTVVECQNGHPPDIDRMAQADAIEPSED